MRRAPSPTLGVQFRRGGSGAAALAVLLLAAPASPSAPGRALLLGDFEDGEAAAPLGSEWTAFFKDTGEEEPPIALEVVPSLRGGMELRIAGRLPDDGTPASWGGAFIDLSVDGAGELDLIAYERLAFRARTDEPALYAVRMECAETRENSRSIVFPADRAGDEVSIPLWRFAPSHRRATRIAFTLADQTPGAAFSLHLDDVAIETATARARAELQESAIPWAPSVQAGWESARARQQPLLMYFTSGVVDRCREFELGAVGGGAFHRAAEAGPLVLVDVSASMDLARQFNVYRVPRFVAMSPADFRTVVVDPLVDGAGWEDLLRDSIGSLAVADAPAVHRASTAAASASASTLIDDFSDMSLQNRAGGMWHPFGRGDRGDIAHRFIPAREGNLALEVFGAIPPAGPDGTTWAGVACDLSPGGGAPRDLRFFRTLDFLAASNGPGRYAVRIENEPHGAGSAMVQLELFPGLQRFSIPLAAFPTGVDAATRIVWVALDPRPGQEFHLVLDDVAFSQ